MSFSTTGADSPRRTHHSSTLVLIGALLASFTLVSNPIVAQQACPAGWSPFEINFDSTAAGAALSSGVVITTQLPPAGTVVTTTNNGTGPDTGMIFDSACPGGCTGGDFDLGSPNSAYGGPGTASPTSDGVSNTDSLSMVLIISEDGDANDPDDEASGGVFEFVFPRVVRIDSVGIMDQDSGDGGLNSVFDVVSGGTATATVSFGTPGDNSVEINVFAAPPPVDTRRLEVDFDGSGATYLVSGCIVDVRLPVELSSFNAITIGESVELAWETASETNNSGFEVQTRYFGYASPGNWETVAFVEGSGTRIEPKSYRYTVRDLAPGRYGFRLKQVDFDGAFEFSSLVEATVDLPEAFLVKAAYPNPITDTGTLEIAVKKSQIVNVEIYTVLGRLIDRAFTGEVESGSIRQVRLSFIDQPAGSYIIRVAGETFETARLVSVVK